MADVRMTKMQIEFACRLLDGARRLKHQTLQKVFESLKPKAPNFYATDIARLLAARQVAPASNYKIGVEDDGTVRLSYIGTYFPDLQRYLGDTAEVKHYVQELAGWRARYRAAEDRLVQLARHAEREIVLGDVKVALGIIQSFEDVVV